MNTRRCEDGYIMPTMVWLMFAVLALMAFVYEGGQLLNDTRRIAIDADIIARDAAQLIDVEGLRFSSDPQLAVVAVTEFVDDAFTSRGYTGHVNVDAAARTVHVVAERQWTPGALGQLGFPSRTIRGTATGVSLRGIDGA